MSLSNGKGHLYLGIISLVGVLWLAAVTYPYGMGVSPDSFYYLAAAKNLCAGEGLFINILSADGKSIQHTPLANWPPFYPLVIAGFLKLGLNLFYAVWLLNLGLFGLNGFLLGSFLLAATASYKISSLGALFFLFAYPTYYTHAYAWSEAPFVTLLMMSFIFLIRHIKTEKISWLILSSAMAGLCWLTRYIGFTVVLSAIIFILYLKEKTWRQRLLLAMIFGLMSSFPIAIWSYHKYKLDSPLYTWKQGDTTFIQDLNEVAKTIALWIFPYLEESVAVIVSLGLLLAIFLPLFLKRGSGTNQEKSSLMLWLTFLTVYLLFLLILSRHYAIGGLENQQRHLFIIWPALLIAGFLALNARKDWWLTKVSPQYLLLICTISLFPLLFKAASWGINTFQVGIEHCKGYDHKIWSLRENSCINWLNKSPVKRMIFTPYDQTLRLLTACQVRGAPSINGLWVAARAANGLVVFLGDGYGRGYFSETELLATGKFTLRHSFDEDGRIYEPK